MQAPLDADPYGHVTCDACWEANPTLWTEWQTGVKTLPFCNFVCRQWKFKIRVAWNQRTKGFTVQTSASMNHEGRQVQQGQKEWLNVGHWFFMIFNNFDFSHGHISKFWNGKRIAFNNLDLLSTLEAWSEVNLKQILNRNDPGENFRIFSMSNYCSEMFNMAWIFTLKNYIPFGLIDEKLPSQE